MTRPRQDGRWTHWRDCSTPWTTAGRRCGGWPTRRRTRATATSVTACRSERCSHQTSHRRRGDERPRSTKSDDCAAEEEATRLRQWSAVTPTTIATSATTAPTVTARQRGVINLSYCRDETPWNEQSWYRDNYCLTVLRTSNGAIDCTSPTGCTCHNGANLSLLVMHPLQHVNHSITLVLYL